MKVLDLSHKLNKHTILSLVHLNCFSADRQWYLYNKIREYSPPLFQHITCPLAGVSQLLTLSPQPPFEPPTDKHTVDVSNHD